MLTVGESSPLPAIFDVLWQRGRSCAPLPSRERPALHRDRHAFQIKRPRGVRRDDRLRAQQLRQLGDVGGDAQGLVAGQTDSSPSGATRRLCRQSGGVEVGDLRLDRRPWHATKKPGIFPREAVATQGRRSLMSNKETTADDKCEACHGTGSVAGARKPQHLAAF